MGNCADRYEVDSSRSDLPNVLQGDAAAGFKFHFIFAQRDRFPDFRGLHVVEENDVDAVDFQKSMDLAEGVSFHFDLNVRMSIAEFAHRFGQLLESGDRSKVIILDQDHVEESKAMVRPAAGNNSGF